MPNRHKEGLSALTQQSLDLMLMAILMPVMGGAEALREIRRTEPTTSRHQPISATTADSMRGDRERSMALGFGGYVALFEIEDDKTVTVLAVRHQREDDYR